MKCLLVLLPVILLSTTAWAQGGQTKVGQKIIFDDGAGHTTTVQNPTLSGSLIDTLPNNAGANGAVLSTNGAGKLSWVAPSGSSGSFTATTQTLSAFSSQQNNLSVSATAGIVNMSTTTTVNLTGITIGSNVGGRYLQLTNTSTGVSDVIIIEDENGSSSAQNQFYIPNQTSVYMGPRGSTYWHYDATLQKWYFDSAN